MDRRLKRIHAALMAGQYGAVVRKAPRLFGTTWDAPARVATAVALLSLGSAAKALEALSAGDVPAGHGSYLRAHAHALLGQSREARRLLDGALEVAPHLDQEARRNPTLAPLLVGSSPGYPRLDEVYAGS